MATAWDHLEIEINAECHNSVCHSAVRLLYTGARVLLSLSVTIWVKLLVFTSLHKDVAISSGCGSSDVLPVKVLQFWISAPFSGERKGKKLQHCCHKMYLLYSLFLWDMESFCFALSSVVVTSIWSAMTGKLLVPSYWVIFALACRSSRMWAAFHYLFSPNYKVWITLT